MKAEKEDNEEEVEGEDKQDEECVVQSVVEVNEEEEKVM